MLSKMGTPGWAKRHTICTATAIAAGAVFVVVVGMRLRAAAHDAAVKTGLGLGADDQIIGFLYLGSPAAPHEAHPRPGLDRVVSQWPPTAG